VAEDKYDDPIAAMQRQINELQRENQNMQKALTEVANANVLPRVLEHGFAEVIAELRPLRDLAPQRESLERPIAGALAAMLTAMQGVTLPGGPLGIPEVSVPFIGQPRPDLPGTPLPGGCQPDPYLPQGKPTQQNLGGGYRS
jgi:hypothetical protein